MPADDDDTPDAFGAPLPPEDRLWRHPSEVAAGGGASPQIVLVSKSGPALGRTLLVAGLAGIIGAALTLGVIVGTDAFVRERPGDAAVEKQAVDVPLVAGKTELAIASVVLPSVARVEASGGPRGVVNSTAVVFRSDGHLVTTADAVDAADTITVYLNDGSKLPAELVSRSIEHDIAVLKVDRTGLPVAVLSQQRVEFADRPTMIDASNASRGAEINIGVVTKESTPFVREGEAPIYGLIQTTTRASVGARSAGSLLIDEGGAVIGMITSRAEGIRGPDTVGITEAGTAPEDGNELHYAVAADFVWAIAAQLTDTGEIVKPSLGIISGTDLSPREAQQRDLVGGGVWVGTLEDGGPAQQVGKLRAGDIIVGIDDTNISGYNDLVVATRRLQPGAQAKLVYVRGGETYTNIVTVAGEVELP